jgi:hypothetical protein
VRQGWQSKRSDPKVRDDLTHLPELADDKQNAEDVQSPDHGLEVVFVNDSDDLLDRSLYDGELDLVWQPREGAASAAKGRQTSAHVSSRTKRRDTRDVRHPRELTTQAVRAARRGAGLDG